MSIINTSGWPQDLDTIEQLMYFLNQLGGGNALAPLATVVANGGNAPTFPTPVTLVSGTAQQSPSLTAKVRYFIQITGGTAGTVKVDIGAANTVTQNLIPATAANAVASQVLVIDVPAGWYIKVTTSVATIVASTVVATGL